MLPLRENSNSNSTLLLDKVSIDEETAYVLVKPEGLIRKRKTQEFIVTSYRIMVIDYKDMKNSYALRLQDCDDVISLNEHRESIGRYQVYGSRSAFSYYAGMLGMSISSATGSLTYA